jgi:anti-anti-sigma factor
VVTRPRLQSPWDGHVLLLHRAEDERLTRTSAWARRGLDLGERVVHADGADGGGLLDALRRRRVDVDAATSAGQLLPVDAERLADPQALRDLAAQALEAGYPGVRLEAPALGRPVPAAPEGEGETQDMCGTGRVSVLCSSDRTRLRGTPLRVAVASHPDGVRAGILSTSLNHAGLALAGEADMSVADVLGAALHAATDAAQGLAWVDVGELRFLDVAAARAVMHATRRFREEGGTVVLLDARPPVRHVLHVLGLDAIEGLVLLGDP